MSSNLWHIFLWLDPRDCIFWVLGNPGNSTRSVDGHLFQGPKAYLHQWPRDAVVQREISGINKHSAVAGRIARRARHVNVLMLMGKPLSRGTVNKRQAGNCAAHVIEFFRICKLVKLVSTSWTFLGIIPTYKDSSMTFPYQIMSSPCPPLRFEVFINILGPFSYKIRLLGTTLTSRCDDSEIFADQCQTQQVQLMFSCLWNCLVSAQNHQNMIHARRF